MPTKKRPGEMPEAGDTVIFTDYSGEEHQATLDQVWNLTCVNLHYFYVTSRMAHTSVCYGERGSKGVWRWPD